MAQASGVETLRPTLRSVSPATGEVVAEVPASTPDDVRAAVAEARAAQPGWAALGASERARAVAALRRRLFERMDDLTEAIALENGKPRAEALSHDIVPSLLTVRYLEAVASRALEPEAVGRLVAPIFGLSSRVEWRPFGVVGCISPWNYPLLLSMMPVAPALLAGNTVVLKPSEFTPGVGELVREIFEVLPKGVATVVQGGGDVGAALVDARCDKLCFIGSAATGRKILEAAAKHLTPVVMELGGQDAAIVCSDADIDIASSGVLWGAFLNAGQTCCAIERAYVVESVADAFEQRVLAKLEEVLSREGDNIGPLTVPRQLEVVERHVHDAVDKGARVLAGGPGAAERRPDGSLWYAPTVLDGRGEDMAMFREETFGPVLPIVRVTDEDEAVERANREGANLTASVWTRDRSRGERIASRLRAGTVTVNDHAVTASAPWGLWGGVGESGYGRLHGTLGLREFSVPVHVARNTMPRLKRPWWYPYDRATTATLRAVATIVGAPTIAEKRRAVRELGANVVRALRAKI